MKDRQTVVTILHGMWKIIPLLYINTRKYMMLGKRELKICRRIQVQGGGRERIYSAHTVLPCIIRPPMTYVYLMEQFFPVTMFQSDEKPLIDNANMEARLIYISNMAST